MSDRLEDSLRALREQRTLEPSHELLARAFPDSSPQRSHVPAILLTCAALLVALLVMPGEAEPSSSALGLALQSREASTEWIELLRGGLR